MNIKTLVSGFAIIGAMAFAGPAFADTMIAGQSIADADLPAVQARCNDLISADATPTSLADANSSEKNAADTAQTANSDNGTTITGDTTPKIDTLASPALVSVLEKLSLEDCKAAKMMPAM